MLLELHVAFFGRHISDRAVLTSSCEATGRVFSCSLPSLQAARKVGLQLFLCAYVLSRILYMAFDNIFFRGMYVQRNMYVRHKKVTELNVYPVICFIKTMITVILLILDWSNHANCEAMASSKQYYDFTQKPKLEEVKTELFPLLLEYGEPEHNECEWWMRNATNSFNRKAIFLMLLTYSLSSWQTALVKSSCSFFQPKNLLCMQSF